MRWIILQGRPLREPRRHGRHQLVLRAPYSCRSTGSGLPCGPKPPWRASARRLWPTSRPTLP